ncbi:RNA polymerase sigma factor [Haliangium sp.]|uniref:RNA polymerase sigma factor n=1 Tax=Haliangium sp. TaxID=2663208 RepID=UPI003D116BA4
MKHDLTDEVLFAAWQQGDRRAGSELFTRHRTSLRRFFRNKVTAEDEDDLVQTTFMACVESSERFRGESSFRTFLFRIAHNKLADHFRVKCRLPPGVNVDDISIADSVPGLSTIQAQNRRQALLLQGLRALTLREQTLLEWYYWERLSAPAIGEILDVPVPNVRSQLRRAKERLLDYMKKHAESPEDLRLVDGEFERWAEEVRPRAASDDESE